LIVAAWGNQLWAAEWADQVLMLIQENIDKPIHCIGTTINGCPKHPMARGKHRVPDNQKPLVWRAA
jgi:hypothetical protein